MRKEVWKDIRGYEGLYQVSNHGRVKSLGNKKTRKEKLLKASKDGAGYLMIWLYKEGKALSKTVHRLVAIAFVNGYKDGLHVNHIDECKINNKASNLEWVTQMQNNNHGTHNKKLSVANGKPIIQYDLEGNEIARFHGAREASRQTGIANSNICNCCNCDKNYSHAGGYIWRYEQSNN